MLLDAESLVNAGCMPQTETVVFNFESSSYALIYPILTVITYILRSRALCRFHGLRECHHICISSILLSKIQHGVGGNNYTWNLFPPKWYQDWESARDRHVLRESWCGFSSDNRRSGKFGILDHCFRQVEMHPTAVESTGPDRLNGSIVVDGASLIWNWQNPKKRFKLIAFLDMIQFSYLLLVGCSSYSFDPSKPDRQESCRTWWPLTPL